jgi:TonB family protein
MKNIIFWSVVLFVMNCSGLSQSASQETYIVRIESVKYPKVAQFARLSGEVTIALRLNGDGSVSDVQKINGSGLLFREVDETVRRWKFNAFEGTERTLTIIFEFSLAGRCDGSNCESSFEYERGGRVKIRSQARAID